MRPLSFESITVDELCLPLLKEKKISAAVLRLDKIHPVISGNKWFKLKYHLENFDPGRHKGIVTFGGAYSNHVIATAYAGAVKGIKTIGIIRGERPRIMSHTLQNAIDFGMQPEFVSRDEYRRKNDDGFIQRLSEKYQDYHFIPEGGGGNYGEKGCMEILSLTEKNNYTHIACAIGTATMFLGLTNSSGLHQQIIGIPVLKTGDIPDQFRGRIRHPAKHLYCKVYYEYHFGGYARHTPALIRFMNEFYSTTGIPSDFVYTAKLFYGICDLIRKDAFPPGSNLLLIHSGGLQGNLSMPQGTLIF